MTTATNLDQRAFRDALGTFVTGVTVITCAGPDGPMGITANSFSSLSLDPPLVLWSPAKSSRRYDTFVNAEEYVIHVAAHDQLDLCTEFAKTAQGPETISWQYTISGSPYLAGCAAQFVCSKHAVFDGGDHSIIVGKVTEFSKSNKSPLIFAAGEYKSA